MKIVIVGGVAGGASAASRLRRLDEGAEIIMLERGEYVSYANCGLPYYIGGIITSKSALTARDAEEFRSRQNIDVRTLHEAVSLNPDRHIVTIRDHRSGVTYEERYDKLILAPGAYPLVPPLPGVDDERVFTLRTVPDTYAIADFIRNKRPARAVVIGAGAIGLEMAENLHNAGIQVAVAELLDHVVPALDMDMTWPLHHHLREKGLTLHLGQSVKSLTPLENELLVNLPSESLAADMVIMSVGVRPESKLAHEAGLAMGVKGTIAVDAHMRTSDPDIYAVGDAVQITRGITGGPASIPLAGPANRQGRIAADHICGIESAYRGTVGTFIIKVFDMTAAATGLNEIDAKAQGIAYDKVYLQASSHAGYYPGAEPMLLKLLFAIDTGAIIGGQIVGRQGVDKRIDVLNAAIAGHMTVYDLANLELAYAPPYSSARDPLNTAGYMAEDLLTGLSRQFHWNEIASLPQDDSISLIDVRTPKEFAKGHLTGAVNIPVDDLRARMAELPKELPVYLYCRSGARSYTALRILAAHGYDVRHLAGGYQLYAGITEEWPDKQ